MADRARRRAELCYSLGDGEGEEEARRAGSSRARLVASTQQGVIGSTDEGKSWRERDRVPNVRFTWPESDALYRIDPGGPVKYSTDGGQTWEDRGTTGGEPQALFADTADHLFVALIDGTIKESDDGGRTWTDLVKPPA